MSVIDPLLGPPERSVDGESETVIGEAEPVTVTEAVFETVEGNLAVIVDVRSVEPGTAVSVKVPVFWFAGTVIVAGTVAADVVPLVSVTEAFEVGVPFSVTVPVAVPVTRLAGLIETD